MERFTEEYRARFAALSTTNVSDAMDALGIHGATYGIRPMWHTMEKVLGPAVTLKMTAAGQTKGKYHLGVRAIDAAEPGDVIVVDNGGRIDTSCWGGVLATGASVKGISGVVIDGACRDLDDCVELNFPVYARGVTPNGPYKNGPGEINVPVVIGGKIVRPGDIVVGDDDGVLFIDPQIAEDLAAATRAVEEKEAGIMGHIVKDGTYIRPWVEEALKRIGCEVV